MDECESVAGDIAKVTGFESMCELKENGKAVSHASPGLPIVFPLCGVSTKSPLDSNQQLTSEDDEGNAVEVMWGYGAKNPALVATVGSYSW